MQIDQNRLNSANVNDFKAFKAIAKGAAICSFLEKK